MWENVIKYQISRILAKIFHFFLAKRAFLCYLCKKGLIKRQKIVKSMKST